MYVYTYCDPMYFYSSKRAGGRRGLQLGLRRLPLLQHLGPAPAGVYIHIYVIITRCVHTHMYTNILYIYIYTHRYVYMYTV